MNGSLIDAAQPLIGRYNAQPQYRLIKISCAALISCNKKGSHVQ